ncbi:hypothetical protein BaRGS_00020889, partial [Batillaria attramentaria]
GEPNYIRTFHVVSWNRELRREQRPEHIPQADVWYVNGGDTLRAFLIPYVSNAGGCGLPLFFMELAFGQFASLGPITIWRINPLLKGLGYGMVIVSWLISLYYNVVISYVLFYLYASLTSVLPWTSCDNDWNTPHCIGFHHHQNTSDDVAISTTTLAAIAEKTSTAAEEYYKRYVLEQTESIDDFGMINWKLAACLLIAWIIVGACLLKGVQSLGKYIRGLSSSSPSSASWLTRRGVDVSEVAKHGPGLAFEVYPEALSQMPVPPLWSVFFFLMMATLGFGSQFSIVECVMSALIDEYRRQLGSRRNVMYFRIAIVAVSFFLGLPMVCGGGMYLLNLVDVSVGGFPLLFIGLIELVAINWIYGFEDFWGDVVMMVGEKPKMYWLVCWKYLSPLVMAYPGWSLALGWMIILFPIVVIPAWFLYKYCALGGWQLLKLRSTPLPTWGPALANNRTDRYGASADIPDVPEGEEPIPIRTRTDLLRVLKPEEFARLLGASTSTINTGSSLTIATNIGGSVYGSKTSV